MGVLESLQDFIHGPPRDPTGPDDRPTFLDNSHISAIDKEVAPPANFKIGDRESDNVEDRRPKTAQEAIQQWEALLHDPKSGLGPMGRALLEHHIAQARRWIRTQNKD